MTLEIIKTKTVKNTAHASDFSAEKTVETIKNVAENIREYSIIIKETTKTIRESGVIPELVGAIREAAFAARDTAKEIHKTTMELKESGAIDDTAHAVNETKRAAQDTIHTVRNTAEQIRYQMK